MKQIIVMRKRRALLLVFILLGSVVLGQYWAFRSSAAVSSDRAADLGIERFPVDPEGTDPESLAEQLSSLAGFDIPPVKGSPSGLTAVYAEVFLGPKPAAEFDSRGRATVRHRNVTLLLGSEAEPGKALIGVTFANGGNASRGKPGPDRESVDLKIGGVIATSKGPLASTGGEAYYLSLESGGSASFARLDTRVSQEEFVAMIRATLGQ